MENSEFKTLEERMLFYRSQNDYRLPKNSHVLVMLDGKNFSQKVKNRFEKPFSDVFISLMDKTAAYVCSEVQGAKFAYAQSDEISIYITDKDSEETGAYYDYRLCKMLSVIASLATSYFNRELIKFAISVPASAEDLKSIIDSEKLYQFDCKAWVVPTSNDVFGWFLYRQNDCIRNSKQQAAQTYLPHKKLLKLSTDEQIKLLLDEKGIDWITYDDGKKYGRLIFKDIVLKNTEINGEMVEFMRSVWNSHPAPVLHTVEGREKFYSLDLIKKDNGTAEQ